MNHYLAEKIIINFTKERPALSSTSIIIAEKQEHIYGEDNTAERIGKIQGAFHPRTNEATFITSNIRNEVELRRTLKHELIGHFGINTFNKEEKLNILTRITEAKDTDLNIEKMWKDREVNYPNANSLLLAEEVFSYVAEFSTNDDNRAAEGLSSLNEAVKTRDRLLTFPDIINIAEMVNKGLIDNTIELKIIPKDNDSQFLKSGLIEDETRLDKNAVEFWRSLVKESISDLSEEQQQENLARFDELAKDPKFIAQLEENEQEHGNPGRDIEPEYGF